MEFYTGVLVGCRRQEGNNVPEVLDILSYSTQQEAVDNLTDSAASALEHYHLISGEVFKMDLDGNHEIVHVLDLGPEEDEVAA